jgi:hypothetical protein
MASASHGRRIKCNINERRVRRHDAFQANLTINGATEEDLSPDIPLEFPCHDSSKGVKDFTDWAYFKKLEKKKIVK